MVDIVDAATRSRMMGGIKGKNTGPELILRRALHARGLRYRLHTSGLPGKPDLVFPQYKAVIFVHGCFWHRHAGCRFTTVPATRAEFWSQKFSANIDRDARNRTSLIELGWRVGWVWECALRDKAAPAVAEIVHAWLISQTTSFIEVSAS